MTAEFEPMQPMAERLGIDHQRLKQRWADSTYEMSDSAHPACRARVTVIVDKPTER
ncbi:hypothetical protein [Nocardia sp. CA-119907]|uniref:hypothetical protein n=1 Tax=Nocardia sp. CA-119907 TaxID=3239973 RepID=UPI003D9955FC